MFALLQKGALFVGSFGTLRLHGNQLTCVHAVGIFNLLREVIHKQGGFITGIFARCLLSDNVIEFAGNLLLCEELSLMGNKFSQPEAIKGLRGGMSFADTAVFVGNQARNEKFN